jgi:hypothetical protein
MPVRHDDHWRRQRRLRVTKRPEGYRSESELARRRRLAREQAAGR